MDDQGGGRPEVVRFRRTWLQRLGWSGLAAAWLLAVMNWPQSSGGGVHPPGALGLGWQVFIGAGVFLSAWALASRSGLDIQPDLGFAVRGVARTDLVPFGDVQTIEIDPEGTGERLVIHTPLGSWKVTAPSSPGDGRFGQKVDAARRAWADAGVPAAPPGLAPWGPDPGAAGSVVLRPTPSQSLVGRPLAAQFGRYLLFMCTTLALAALFHGQWVVGAVVLALPALLAPFALRGPRTVVRADGVELRQLVRTTFVPWSIVSTVTIASTPLEWRPRGSRGSKARRPLLVRLLTPGGWFDLPAPVLRADLVDPAAWRKADFIERAWEAHRGDRWVGAPSPPPLPPPPQLPPPPSFG